MNDSSIVTIVIPVRDRAALIERTLDSIAQQDIRPINLVIVDNGSTDNTFRIMERWAARHRADDFNITLLSEPQPGASRARNRGLKEVTSPYVMFFDSDDTMEYDHLSRVAGELQRNPETDILHWAVAFRDPDGWTDKKESREDGDKLSEQILHSILGTQRYCVRTDFIRNAGYWNESLSTWDDYELGVRLLCSSPAPTIRYLNGSPRVIINYTDDSLTGPTFSSRAEPQQRALDAIDAILDNRPSYRQLLNAKRAVLAANYRREGSRSLARQTLNDALQDKKGFEKLKLHIIYTVQRLAGKGGSFLAPLLFKEKHIG